MKYSLLKRKRLNFIAEAAAALKLKGSFVELGAWRGGSAAKFITNLEKKDVDCWLFDSFEGMPEPTEYDIHENKHASSYKNLGLPDDDSNTYNICTDLMKSLNYPYKKIHIVKGWFEDTFPAYVDKIGKIAVLHVDCDWYESVKESFEVFYDRVVDGGLIIIDDYGFWRGARKAADEFFQNRDIKPELNDIDETGRWLIKKNMYDIKGRPQFIDIINGEDYKTAAEIGLDQGVNATYLLENTDLEKLYCFELWKTSMSKKNREETTQRMTDKFGDRFVLVEGKSAVKAVEFEDGFFDYIYIDGDHRRRGIGRDLAAFWPKVREGGFFGGHDYCVAERCGVIPAVDNMAEAYGIQFNITEDPEVIRPSFWLIK